MKQTIILKTEGDIKRACAILSGLKIEPLHEIIIREHKKDISAEQRALYWIWITTIAHELGNTKEEMHKIYKDKFLVNIYERDCPEYAEIIHSLRSLYKKGMQQEALTLRKRIIELTSITTATIVQMQEYMHDIELMAYDLGIRLPAPPSLR